VRNVLRAGLEIVEPKQKRGKNLTKKKSLCRARPQGAKPWQKGFVIASYAGTENWKRELGQRSVQQKRQVKKKKTKTAHPAQPLIKKRDAAKTKKGTWETRTAERPKKNQKLGAEASRITGGENF